MTLTDIQTYFDDSPCVAGLTQGQLLQLLVIILAGGTLTQSQIQAYFDESPCIGGLTQGQLWQLFALVAGGVSGGGVIEQEAGPVSGWAAPSNPGQTSLKWNSTDGIIYVWNTDTQAWEPTA